MKKLVLSLLAIGLVLAFTNCDVKKENLTVTLSGKIENPNSERMVISLDNFPEDIVLDTVFLKGDGSFSATFDLDKCGPATIHDGKESTHCYLCPGDSLYITLNTEKFDESIEYKGVGAEKNEFLVNYYLQFLDYENPEFVNFYGIRDTVLDVFMGLAAEVNKKATAYYEAEKAQGYFPAEFNAYMETRLYYQNVSNYQYVFYRKNRDTTEKYMKMEDEVRKKILHAGEYPEPDCKSKEYQTWVRYTFPMALSNKLRMEFKGEDADREFYDSVTYARLDQYLSPKEIQMYLYNKINSLAYSYNLESMKTMRPLIDKFVLDTILLGVIDQKYADVEKALNQDLPEDATLFNLDDEDLLELTFKDVLDKYKGNVIYLDFWASWCGPCKAEMPNSAALSKKLKDEEVVFLYVSTDKDPEAWVQMIKIMQLHGLHYRLGKNTRKPVFEEFGIRYIPHYVLFDKDGKMVKNNMSRPGDPKTEEMIRELL